MSTFRIFSWQVEKRLMGSGRLIADLFEAVKRAEKAAADASMQTEAKDEAFVRVGSSSERHLKEDLKPE